MYTPLIALGAITASFTVGASLALAFGLAPVGVFLAGAVAGILVPGLLAARFFTRSDS